MFESYLARPMVTGTVTTLPSRKTTTSTTLFGVARLTRDSSSSEVRIGTLVKISNDVAFLNPE